MTFTHFPNGLSVGRQKFLTIASGVIDVSGKGSNIVVDTESAAASDDLDTITLKESQPEQGAIVILTAADSSRTVVVKDGTGNLRTAGDFSLTNVEDRIVLMRTGTDFVELSRSNNAA